MFLLYAKSTAKVTPSIGNDSKPKDLQRGFIAAMNEASLDLVIIDNNS